MLGRYLDPTDASSDAAKLIEEKGWVQNEYASEKGYCVAAAITTICLPHGSNSDLTLKDQIDLHNSAMYEMSNFLGRHNPSVIGWNDNQVHSKEEVLKTMRDCVARLQLQKQLRKSRNTPL